MAKEIKREVSKVTGNTRITYDDGSTKIIKATAKTTPAKYDASNPGPAPEGTTLVPASETLPQYGRQHYDSKKGHYVATDLKTGKEAEMKISEFEARHPRFVEEYAKQNPGKTLGQDLLSKDVSTRSKAANWFQTTYAAESSKRPNMPQWFDPKADPNKSPKGIDSKFGFHTWSAPALDPIPGAVIPGITDNIPAAKTTTEDDVKADHFQQPEVNPDYAPWWLQDQIKTFGAAADFARIKKRMPWQATPNMVLPDPTFYDPTRQLAANTEMTNLTMQAANQFNNPQLAAALTLAAQAQGAGNAANILGNNENQNVGVANQFASNNAASINNYSNNRANASTQLYDKNIAASQNFDNSRNMARQNLRQNYIDAITNRRMTQNLNTMYPQFAVDPSLGGPMFFKDHRELTGKVPNQKDFTAAYNEYITLPQMTPAEAAKQARLSLGMQDPDEYVNQAYGKQNPNFGYPQ